MSEITTVLDRAARAVDIGTATWFADIDKRIVFPTKGLGMHQPDYCLYLVREKGPARVSTIIVGWLELAAIDFNQEGTVRILEAKIKEAGE